MSVFAIARRNTSELDTVVFSAGKNDSAEAVALFNTQDRAAEYIFDAGWGESHTVAEMKSADLFQWMCELDRDGIEYLAIDPTRAPQLEGGLQSMLTIRSELESAGERLCGRIQSLKTESDPAQLQEVALHHCQICGKVFRVRLNEPEPICCDRPAEKATTDTERLENA